MTKNKKIDSPKDEGGLDLEHILKVLDPIDTLIEVQGEPFNIKQFKFRESIKVIEVLKKYPDAIPFNLLDKSLDVETMLLNLFTSASQATSAIDEIIKIHLKKDDEWMEKIEIDEMVKIAMAIFKVNVDFFFQKVIPMIPTSIKENLTVEKVS